MRIRRVFRFGLSAIVGLFLVSCSTAPITGRRQLSFIGEGQEMQLGISEFDKMKQSTPISKDPAANQLVQKVGERIAAVAEEYLPNAQWEFIVFQSKEANAFCLPGGKVGVYTGILPLTKDEAGLATVLGHEIAHAAAHHGAERMSQSLATQTAGQVLGAGLSAYDPRVQSAFSLFYPTASKLVVELPYDRKQESEADHIGLILMARAGYDPHAAVEFWQRFSDFNKSQGGAGGFALLRTHPVDEVRIEQLKKWLPEALAQYKGGVISRPAK